MILAAYKEWGTKCLDRFMGMFAIAILDAKNKTLFLARDRFGIKPLLYYSDKKHFAFASEMKAFLYLDWFPFAFNEGMISASLLDSKVIEGTEQSLLQNLNRLLGGHSLTLQQDKKIETDFY